MPDDPSLGVLRALTALEVEPVVARPHVDHDDLGAIRYVKVAARGDTHDPMDFRWSRKGLRSALRDAGADIVHVVGDPWTPNAEAGAAAARSVGVPYVLVGNSIVGGPTGTIARWQARRVVEGAAALGGTSRPAMERLANGRAGVPQGVVPPSTLAFPPRRTPRTDSSPVVIGSIGRVMGERGLDVLFAALGTTFGDWRLRIVGTGPAQEALEAQAQRLGLSSRIEWLGAIPRDALGEFWGSLDVLVTPSRATPSWVEPNAHQVLDAMAHGIAVVVTRSGVLPDVVGESGLIVEPDDATALARALQGLVEQPSRVETLGEAARKRVVERFSDVAIADRMVALWRQALAR